MDGWMESFTTKRKKKKNISDYSFKRLMVKLNFQFVGSLTQK